MNQTTNLPDPVRRYLAHALPQETKPIRRARLQMHGRIKVGGWMRFEAEWEGDGTSFSWRALAGPGRLRPLRVHDRFANGRGAMDVRLRPNLKLIHDASEDVARSGAGRAALEAVWVPGSLLTECGVTWTAESDQLIAATRDVPPERPQLNLTIDSSGALVSCHGQRFRDAKHGYLPFGAIVDQERTFNGTTIPSKLAVGWGFSSDDWQPFFECEVTGYEAAGA